MTSRRTALLGIAALPLASLPTLAAPSAPDAFLNIHRRISEARAYANKDGVVGDEFEAAMDRLRDIEREGGETPPTTIEGAIVGLEWARYEHIEFGDPDVGIVLAMIDGALNVLRGWPMSDRRAFLRSLASLPLIAPTAAVVPVTDELLWGYKGWLANEHKMLCGEMTGYDAAKMQALHHLFYNAHPASDWHFEWPNPGYRLAGWIDAPQPSTRAAVVLSAAGVGLG